MPCYRLPLVLRMEPLLLDLDAENDLLENSSLRKTSDNAIFKVGLHRTYEIKRDLIWHKNETHTIRVYADYPLNIPIIFDKVSAIVKGMNAICYSSSVSLQSKPGKYSFDVKVRPLETGVLHIQGVSIGFSNIICHHFVQRNGVGIYAIDQEKKYPDTICDVRVVEEIPRISSRIEAIQLSNGCLVGMKGEQCHMNIYIKNISATDIPIARLELKIYTREMVFNPPSKKYDPALRKTIVYGSEFAPAKLFKKVDLIKEFSESPKLNKWYRTEQIIPMLENTDLFGFEIQFATNPDVVLLEKYEVPITTQLPNKIQRAVAPSINITKCEWKSIVTWQDSQTIALPMLPENKKILPYSDSMKLIVGIQNMSIYPLMIGLEYEGKLKNEISLEVQTTKNLAAEIPYEIEVKEKTIITWKVPSLCRFGKGTLNDFVYKQDMIPVFKENPIKIKLFVQNVNENTKVIKGKVGDLFRIGLNVKNVSSEIINSIASTIILVKSVAENTSELLNNNPYSIGVSGDLTYFIDTLNKESSYEQYIDILFTERNTYQIGALVDFTSTDFCYALGHSITFEID